MGDLEKDRGHSCGELEAIIDTETLKVWASVRGRVHSIHVFLIPPSSPSNPHDLSQEGVIQGDAPREIERAEGFPFSCVCVCLCMYLCGEESLEDFLRGAGFDGQAFDESICECLCCAAEGTIQRPSPHKAEDTPKEVIIEKREQQA